jgi:hypothetical protein
MRLSTIVQDVARGSTSPGRDPCDEHGPRADRLPGREVVPASPTRDRAIEIHVLAARRNPGCILRQSRPAILLEHAVRIVGK